MWQRKQTLFLLCSLAAVIVCLLSPVGAVTSETVGAANLLTNLGWSGESVERLPAWPLFIFMAITGILSVVDIFLYHNRKRQMSICSYAMLSDLLWYVYYIVFYAGISASMHIRFAACLPLVSCIFLFMAKKGIKADDDLVKSMDRIR